MSRTHQLHTVVVGDDATSWAEAGFSLDGARTTIGRTAVECAGDGSRGITSIGVDGVAASVDGMPFTAAAPAVATSTAVPHSNGVVGIDHLVAMSPDMDRTTAALISAGLDHRRDRRFEAAGSHRRQAFFWLGDVILELVGDDDAHGSGPAVVWGLALTVTDLDATADALGDRLGRVKEAVQPGRKIATLRTDELGISVPIALMTPHADA